MIGIPFILAGIIMLIITVCLWLKKRSFENNGAVCTAAVVDRKTGYTRVNKRRVETYSLVLSYQVNGVDYTADLLVPKDEYDRPLGYTVEIYYKKNKPEKIMTADPEKAAKDIRVLLIVTVSLFVLGALMLLLK